MSTDAKNAQAGASEAAVPPARTGRLDWPALGAALIVAAFFALTARFNSQPSPSYVPAAIFSATGCGLLVTAIHTLRRRAGAGLWEAALAGLGMALLQFLVTFTYPGVWSTITSIPEYSRAFLLTWGLIALFAVILSMAGAGLGYLAFSPLRAPATRAPQHHVLDEEEEEEEEQEPAEQERPDVGAEAVASSEILREVSEEQGAESSETSMETSEEEDEEAEEEDEDGDTEGERALADAQGRKTLLSHVVAVLLLGLLPMMVGYVFAASYDFVMNAINVTAISPALYPTLSLLSGLLPWRLPAPIALGGQNGAFIVFTLLWRIPDSTLGNPNLFDVQALESLLFNALGLALLLIALYRDESKVARRGPVPWGVFLLLESLLGLVLILPANLWLLRGLEGVLQMGGVVIALPTLRLINPVLFTLNLVTGVLFCLIVGLIVRRQYQLWTSSRVKTTVEQEEQQD